MVSDISSLPPVTCRLFCSQIVLENSSREDKHECPFGRSSIELTKMLCEILKVGELRKYPRFLCGVRLRRDWPRGSGPDPREEAPGCGPIALRPRFAVCAFISTCLLWE